MRGMNVYAIRVKDTELFLPERKKRRGFSHDEPTPLTVSAPRYFTSLSSAQHALTAWLMGRWERVWSAGGEDGPDEYA